MNHSSLGWPWNINSPIKQTPHPCINLYITRSMAISFSNKLNNNIPPRYFHVGLDQGEPKGRWGLDQGEPNGRCGSSPRDKITKRGMQRSTNKQKEIRQHMYEWREWIKSNINIKFDCRIHSFGRFPPYHLLLGWIGECQTGRNSVDHRSYHFYINPVLTFVIAKLLVEDQVCMHRHNCEQRII